MLNNKGQAIVIFAILLPVILLIVTYIYDVSNMGYEKNKLNGISKIIKDNPREDSCVIALKNDKDVLCEQNSNIVTLKKRVKSIFGKIAKKDYYEIKITINLGDV